MKIDMVPVDRLKPASYNPRKMTDEARARLEAGIKEFGLVDPILARQEDGLILGGHQRLQACIKLGMTEVPVIFIEGVTDSRAKALNILLNNPNAQGEWDQALLAQALVDMRDDELDLTLTGFNEDELVEILAGDVVSPTEPEGPACPQCGRRLPQ